MRLTNRDATHLLNFFRTSLNADEFIKFEAALMWCKNNSDKDVVKFRYRKHNRKSINCQFLDAGASL